MPPAPAAATLDRFWVRFSDQSLEAAFVRDQVDRAPRRLGRYLALFALYTAANFVMVTVLSAAAGLQVVAAAIQAIIFLLLSALAMGAPKLWNRLMTEHTEALRRAITLAFVATMAVTVMYQIASFDENKRDGRGDERLVGCLDSGTVVVGLLVGLVVFIIFSLIQFVTAGDKLLLALSAEIGLFIITASDDITWALFVAVLGGFVLAALVLQIRGTEQQRRLAFLLLRRLEQERIHVSLLFDGSSKVADSGGTADPGFLISPAAVSVEKLVGTGGFGKVYKGTWRGTVVAVKKLVEPSEQRRRDLIREAGMLLQLRHPHVVLFLALAMDDETTMLVAEYCEFGSLDRLVEKANTEPESFLPMHRRLSLLAQAASGMAFLHLHEPAIVHRDLKPANLLVDRRWTCKVADFGTVNKANDDEVAPPMMTVLYASPGVLAGELYRLADDVYSFALCIFECVTGELPFANEMASKTALALIDEVQNGLRPDPVSVAEAAGPEVQDLAVRAWSADPAQRPTFVNIQEVLEEVEHKTVVAQSLEKTMSLSPMMLDTTIDASVVITVLCRSLNDMLDGRRPVSTAESAHVVEVFAEIISRVRQGFNVHVRDLFMDSVVLEAHDMLEAMAFALAMSREFLCVESMEGSIVGVCEDAVFAPTINSALQKEVHQDVCVIVSERVAHAVSGSDIAEQVSVVEPMMGTSVDQLTRYAVSSLETASRGNYAVEEKPSTAEAQPTATIGIPAEAVEIGAARGTGAVGPVFDATYQGAAATVKRVEGVRGRAVVTLAKDVIAVVTLEPHAHVVRLLGVSRMGQTPVLVSEYIDATLASVLADEVDAVGAHARVELVRQAALGLAHLHGRLGPHGLLSPAAIAVSADRTVAKVGDYGLTRTLGDFAVRTQTQTLSPVYLSPELLKGEVFGEASDVFALGIVLLEAETGQSASGKKKWYEIVEERRHGLRPMVAAGLRARVRATVERATRPAAAERPAASEFAKMLEVL